MGTGEAVLRSDRAESLREAASGSGWTEARRGCCLATVGEAGLAEELRRLQVTATIAVMPASAASRPGASQRCNLSVNPFTNIRHRQREGTAVVDRFRGRLRPPGDRFDVA